jgi:hypothetical protein
MTSFSSMSETMRISREHFGAPQRVGLPHLLDQLAPLLARDAAPIPAWSPGAQEWPMERQNQNK